MKQVLQLLLVSLGISLGTACNPIDKREVKSAMPAATPAPALPEPVVTADTGASAHAIRLGPDTLAVIDDAFVSQALNKFLRYHTVVRSRRSFQLSQQTEPTDNPQVTDTLSTFSTQSASFTFLHSGDPAATSPALVKARIASAAIKLPKNVRVGMPKAAFATGFHLGAVPAVIVLADTEGYQVFTFTFANDVLVSVAFESNYLG